MNRSGLIIALGLALVVGLLFGIYPELDIKLAALFYDAATRSFPLKLNTMAAFARDGAMWIAWGIALPAIVALVVKLLRPDRPLLISGRAIIFLLVTLTLSAGILTNLTFKSYWGRPRPVGSARRLRPQLFVLLRRRRHRVLDLRACGIDAAGLAAAGLCRRHAVRRDDQRAPDGVRWALLHRRRRRRAGDVSGDLAGARLYLSLAVDPALRRAHRRRADTAWLAGISPPSKMAWARCGARSVGVNACASTLSAYSPAKFVGAANSTGFS